jgi:glycerol-3-phosphate acyltransferase PlsY
MRLAALSLVGVLIGHVAPIFYKFKGGKGIAATMGGLLAIMPNTLIIGILVWLVIYHATKIVSVASMCFIASTLLTSYLFSYPKECMVLAILLNIIIFWRHRENIVRLANGTEYKFTKRG